MCPIPTAQLFEAVEYLHENANILQNDIKCDNILLADDTSISASSSSTSALDYHIVLVDFGKAADKESGRRYHLSETEKVTYMTKYPHIAPEVTHGECRPTTKSEIFSLGRVLVRLSDYGCFDSLSVESKSYAFF